MGMKFKKNFTNKNFLLK